MGINPRLRKLRYGVPGVLLILLLLPAGCGWLAAPPAAPPPAGTTGAPAPSTVPQATAVPQPTAPAAVAAVTATIRITTTSDWTNLSLVGGGSWVALASVVASPEAAMATVEGNLIRLGQPTARAEAGQPVTMTLDVVFRGLDPAGRVLFDIQRGFIGATWVQILSGGGQPGVLAAFAWDQVNQNNGNHTEIVLPAAQLLAGPPAPPAPNDYIVIAQLNVWFHGAGCHGGFEDFVYCSGRRTTPLEPALGHTYDSADPRVVQQQIAWAADYGVDAFSLEWTTPRGIGTSGSLEDNIDDAFLRAPNLWRIRWCIFYDTVLRMTQDPAVNADVSNGINFDDPNVYNAFVADFSHFAVKYFGQPQYLNIDGRPVVYIYAAWNFHGNYAGAIQEARAAALAQGYDVFLAGDAMRADRFDGDLASQFDADTTFTFLIAGLPGYADVGEAAVGIDSFFRSWRANIQGLKVAGREDLVNFQPAWAPQFDNRLFEPQNPIYVPALSKDQVLAMARAARDNAEPVGSLGQKLVWINTWNNWAETTTIEPTADQGPKYPAGNYGFDMLEVVSDVFGMQTFGSGTPAP